MNQRAYVYYSLSVISSLVIIRSWLCDKKVVKFIIVLCMTERIHNNSVQVIVGYCHSVMFTQQWIKVDIQFWEVSERTLMVW